MEQLQSITGKWSYHFTEYNPNPKILIPIHSPPSSSPSSNSSFPFRRLLIVIAFLSPTFAVTQNCVICAHRFKWFHFVSSAEWIQRRKLHFNSSAFIYAFCSQESTFSNPLHSFCSRMTTPLQSSHARHDSICIAFSCTFFYRTYWLLNWVTMWPKRTAPIPHSTE